MDVTSFNIDISLSLELLEEFCILLLQLLVRTEDSIPAGYAVTQQFNSVFVLVTQLIEEGFVVLLSKMEGKFFASHGVCDAPNVLKWAVARRILAAIEVRREIFYPPGPRARW